MNKYIILTFSIIITIFGTILESCGKDDSPAGLTTDEDAIRLRLTFAPSLSMSRADTWNDSYLSTTGDNFEDAISSVDILLYDLSGKFLSRLPWKRDNASPATFLVSLDSDSPWLATTADGNKILNGKITVTANSGNGESLSGPVLFNHKITELNGIPMWGVKQYSGVEIKTDRVNHLGNVAMLRAMAKVTVTLSDEIDDYYEITSVTMTGYADKGNAVPEGATTISETGNLEIDGCFNPVTSLVTQPLSFQKQSDGTYIAYIPEIEKPENSDILIKVEMITTSDKRDVKLNDPHIHFVEYSDRAPTDIAYNIIRNHCYNFEITRVSEKLETLFTVCGWDNKSTEISFE